MRGHEEVMVRRLAGGLIRTTGSSELDRSRTLREGLVTMVTAGVAVQQAAHKLTLTIEQCALKEAQGVGKARAYGRRWLLRVRLGGPRRAARLREVADAVAFTAEAAVREQLSGGVSAEEAARRTVRLLPPGSVQRYFESSPPAAMAPFVEALRTAAATEAAERAAAARRLRTKEAAATAAAEAARAATAERRRGSEQGGGASGVRAARQAKARRRQEEAVEASVAAAAAVERARQEMRRWTIAEAATCDARAAHRHVGVGAWQLWGWLAKLQRWRLTAAHRRRRWDGVADPMSDYDDETGAEGDADESATSGTKQRVNPRPGERLPLRSSLRGALDEGDVCATTPDAGSLWARWVTRAVATGPATSGAAGETQGRLTVPTVRARVRLEEASAMAKYVTGCDFDVDEEVPQVHEARGWRDEWEESVGSTAPRGERIRALSLVDRERLAARKWRAGGGRGAEVQRRGDVRKAEEAGRVRVQATAFMAYMRQRGQAAVGLFGRQLEAHAGTATIMVDRRGRTRKRGRRAEAAGAERRERESGRAPVRKQGWIVERVLEVRRCAHGRSEWTEARLRWAGLNPVNGLPWSDSWEPTSANGVAARNRRDGTRGGGGLTAWLVAAAEEMELTKYGGVLADTAKARKAAAAGSPPRARAIARWRGVLRQPAECTEEAGWVARRLKRRVLVEEGETGRPESVAEQAAQPSRGTEHNAQAAAGRAAGKRRRDEPRDQR